VEFIDAKALRHFLAVVRHGSFRGAAEHLNVAPSAVSRQMAELEQELGLPLFERTARGVTLTPAGTLLLEHGRRMGDAHGALNAELDRLKGGEQRRIAIACGEGFVADLVQNGIKPFMAIHPQLRHGLTLLGTDAILDAITNGEADIGIVYNPPVDTRVRSIAIKRQPLCIVAAAGLVASGPADLAACLRLPVALLTKGHGIRSWKPSRSKRCAASPFPVPAPASCRTSPSPRMSRQAMRSSRRRSSIRWRARPAPT
jgi:DNA-binding transcriptional LysR family regulator